MRMRYFYILAGIIIYMCVGSIYSWSVFRKPLEQILNIGATQSGTPYMLFLLFFSLTMPFAGRFMEILKPFKTILLGAFFLLIGFLVSGFSKDILYISIAYGVIAGIGVGIIYGVPIAVVAKWIPERKGFAMGLTLIGFGLSPFVTAPVIKNFINLYGPFTTFKILGILFFIIIVLFALSMKFPDAKDENKTQFAIKSEEQKGYTPREMIKTKEFYGLWICYTIGTFSGLMAIGITSPFAQEIVGMTGNQAAFFVSMFAIFNGIGRPIFGFLTDKLKPFKTIFIIFVILLIASVFGIFIDRIGKIFFVLVFSLLWLSLGGWLALAPATTAMIFGTKSYPSNYGIVFTAYGAGAVLGTIISGVIKDILGSYIYVFYPVIVLSIVGLIVCIFTLRSKLTQL